MAEPSGNHAARRPSVGATIQGEADWWSDVERLVGVESLSPKRFGVPTSQRGKQPDETRGPSDLGELHQHLGMCHRCVTPVRISDGDAQPPAVRTGASPVWLALQLYAGPTTMKGYKARDLSLRRR